MNQVPQPSQAKQYIKFAMNTINAFLIALQQIAENTGRIADKLEQLSGISESETIGDSDSEG